MTSIALPAPVSGQLQMRRGIAHVPIRSAIGESMGYFRAEVSGLFVR
jgi:hypothetical protein